MEIVEALELLGGVASRDSILRLWTTAGKLSRATHAGQVLRVRKGWYALPDARKDVVAAVRVGGSLTCSRALMSHEVWTMPDERVHVSVPSNASRLRSLDGVVLHWRRSPGVIHRAVDPVPDALAHLAECGTREAAIAAIDSALYLGLTNRPELKAVFRSSTSEARRRLALADATSESGLETFARLRLRSLGIQYRTQVPIPGVGRVDLLVGKRLVVELDGFRFHTREAFEEDRRRDLVLQRLGFAYFA